MTIPDSKQRSLHQYGKVGDAYVRSNSHAKGIDLKTLVAIASPQKDWLVLDVATGGGHTALAFAPKVRKVIATDLTPNMLTTAENFICGEKGVSNVEFRFADAEDLPFPDAFFDLVTCRIAPHHFPDCQRFVNETARVLKREGILLVQDHVLPEDRETAKYIEAFETLRDPSHNRAFAESEWRAMFHQAGLRIEYVETLEKRHEFRDWAKRMNNSEETIQALIEMVKEAPEQALNWLMPLPNPSDFDSPQASFVNHHIILLGRK